MNKTEKKKTNSSSGSKLKLPAIIILVSLLWLGCVSYYIHLHGRSIGFIVSYFQGDEKPPTVVKDYTAVNLGKAEDPIARSPIAGSNIVRIQNRSIVESGAIPLPGIDHYKDNSGNLKHNLDNAADAEIVSPIHPATTEKKKKIAYAITVTKDGPFVDGALVLGYSAQKVHDAKYGYHSEYEAELIAFVTVEVVKARPILEKYGWIVLEKPLPVQLAEIKNEVYAEKMKNSGCCGAAEFLKLWAYTLVQYHRVVHLDMDSIIFRNMDELYELDYELLFTGDHNMRGRAPVPPVQGGFLVLRPSAERFEELRSIIRIGDHGSKGWAGSHIGNFWGGMTIQGILPYFYHSVHSGDSKELNRCVYNCMVDNPFNMKTMKCLDHHETCEDCRAQVPENVSSAHFTICQKPWTCTKHDNPRNSRLCAALHAKWFELREEFEVRVLEGEVKDTFGVSDRSEARKHKYPPSINTGSMGMCKGWGPKKYINVPL